MRLLPKKKTVYSEADANDVKLAGLLDHHDIGTVFDIGANKGQYAKRLRGAGYAGRIISFEPLADNHAVLENESAQDALWEIAPQMAVGDSNGRTEIHVSESNDMSSILELEQTTLRALPKSQYVATQTVDVKTIDSIFEDFRDPKGKTFIKVDTQGFEFPVLQGAQDTIATGNIAGWQLELSLLPLYQGEPTFEEIVTWLKDHGYETHFLIPGYFSKKLHRQMQFDGVFFLSCKS